MQLKCSNRDKLINMIVGKKRFLELDSRSRINIKNWYKSLIFSLFVSLLNKYKKIYTLWVFDQGTFVKRIRQ